MLDSLSSSFLGAGLGKQSLWIAIEETWILKRRRFLWGALIVLGRWGIDDDP